MIAHLPAGARRLEQTSVFTEATLPEPLTRPHAPARGAWQLVEILEGRLRWRLDDPLRLSRSTILTPKTGARAIAPGELHHFELLGPMTLRLEEDVVDGVRR